MIGPNRAAVAENEALSARLRPSQGAPRVIGRAESAPGGDR